VGWALVTALSGMSKGGVCWRETHVQDKGEAQGFNIGKRHHSFSGRFTNRPEGWTVRNGNGNTWCSRILSLGIEYDYIRLGSAVLMPLEAQNRCVPWPGLPSTIGEQTSTQVVARAKLPAGLGHPVGRPRLPGSAAPR